MKQIKLAFLFTMLLSMVGVQTFAHDLAVENADGVTIFYNYINDGTELEVAQYPSDLKYEGNVVIPDEVTYENETYQVTGIGDGAFSGCSDLTSVTIPNSVTSIGNAAFWYCSGLTSITIPNSVTSIGVDTFHMCTGLTSISIPNSVTSIGGCAFSGCEGLTSVTIPNSVTSIGDGAFEDCTDLKKVIVKDIAAWCNISFGISNSNPLYYAHHLYSDENTEITDLVIPNSVTSIGNNAFSGCKGLTSVTIPNSVTTIEFFAFEGCTSLTSVTIPNSVTSIRGCAFSGCTGLTSVTIPNSVTSIGDYAFSGCTDLKKVIVKDIAAWCNISFGISNSNPLYYAHHLYSDENTEITDLVIPNSVTSIGNNAFSGCKGLTSVTIPNSVTTIEFFAFEGCTSLTSVTIPNSVTSIGDGAFYVCTGLKKVIVKDIAAWCNISFGDIDSNPLYHAHHLYSDENTEITDLVIPDNVTIIRRHAFYGCSGLTSVIIPNSVTRIGNSAFKDCTGLKNVIVNDIAAWCNIILYGYDSNPLFYAHHLYSDEKTEITNLVIPNSVTTIGGYVFYGCTGLTSVTIPNSVTTIGNRAFEGCTGLPSVTIPNSVKSIGSGAFDWCKNLATVISLIEFPFVIHGKSTYNKVFSENTFQNATLYVPEGTIEKYKATEGWKDFVFIEEGLPNGIADVPAQAVLLQSEDGVLSVQGLADGTPVSVYGMNGIQAGSAVSKGGQAIVAPSLPSGSVAIVKMGEKRMKVVVK